MERWGEVRSQRHMDRIRDGILLLGKQPWAGRRRSEILPDLRSFVVLPHVVFYRVRGEQLEILRVLHQRQDITRNHN